MSSNMDKWPRIHFPSFSSLSMTNWNTSPDLSEIKKEKIKNCIEIQIFLETNFWKWTIFQYHHIHWKSAESLLGKCRFPEGHFGPSIIILALLNKLVYDYRGNNTYVIQEKTALYTTNLPITSKVFWKGCTFFLVAQTAQKKQKINTPLFKRL